MIRFLQYHDDVIKWKHFPRYWPFVRGIHRSPVNSPHKGQWRGALMFSLICVWINGWVNNREVGDLRLYRAHYGVIVMRHFHTDPLGLSKFTKTSVIIIQSFYTFFLVCSLYVVWRHLVGFEYSGHKILVYYLNSPISHILFHATLPYPRSVS